MQLSFRGLAEPPALWVYGAAPGIFVLWKQVPMYIQVSFPSYLATIIFLPWTVDHFSLYPPTFLERRFKFYQDTASLIRFSDSKHHNGMHGGGVFPGESLCKYAAIAPPAVNQGSWEWSPGNLSGTQPEQWGGAHKGRSQIKQEENIHYLKMNLDFIYKCIFYPVPLKELTQTRFLEQMPLLHASLLLAVWCSLASALEGHGNVVNRHISDCVGFLKRSWYVYISKKPEKRGFLGLKVLRLT